MAQQAVAVELFSTSILSNHKVRSRHERYVSILQVKKIPFVYHDLASDEEAKSTWRSKALDKQIPGLLVHGEWRGTFEEFEEAIEFGELDLFLRIDQERAKREAVDGTIPQPAPAPIQAPKIAQNGSTLTPHAEATPRKPSKHVVKTVTPLAQPRQPSMNALAPALPMAAPGSVRRKKDDAEGFLRSLGIEDLNLTEEELKDLMQAGQTSSDKSTTSAEQRNDSKYPDTLGIGSSSVKQAVPRTYVPSAEAGVKPLRLAKMGDGISRSASAASPHARYNASQTSSRALAAEAQASTSSRAFSAVKLREAVSQGDDLKSAMSQTRLTSNTDAAEHVVGREDIDDLLASLGLDDVKMTDEEAEAFLFEGTVPDGLGLGGERVRKSGSMADRARNETAAREVAQRARQRGYGSSSSTGSLHSRSSSAASSSKAATPQVIQETKEELIGDKSVIVKPIPGDDDAAEEHEVSTEEDIATADTITARKANVAEETIDTNVASSDTILARKDVQSPPQAPVELPELVEVEPKKDVDSEAPTDAKSTGENETETPPTTAEVTPSTSKTAVTSQAQEEVLQTDEKEIVAHVQKMPTKEEESVEDSSPEVKPQPLSTVDEDSKLEHVEKEAPISPKVSPTKLQEPAEENAPSMDKESSLQASEGAEAHSDEPGVARAEATHEDEAQHTQDSTPRQSRIDLTNLSSESPAPKAASPIVERKSIPAPISIPASSASPPLSGTSPSPKSALRYSQLQLDSSFAALASHISSGKRDSLPELPDEAGEGVDRPVIMERKASLSPSVSAQISPSVPRRSLASISGSSTSSISPQKGLSSLPQQQPSSPHGQSMRSPSSSSIGHSSRSTNRRKAIDVQRPAVSSPTSDSSLSSPPGNALGMLRMPSLGRNGRSTSQVRSSSSTSDHLSVSPETSKPGGKSPKSPAMKLFSIGKRKSGKKGRRSSGSKNEEEDEEADQISTLDTRRFAGGNDRSQKTLSVILREADEAMSGVDGDDDDMFGLDGGDDDVGAFDFDIDLDADDGIEYER